MTDKLDPDHVEWSRKMFAMMAEGGTWGVPRSGLIFQKHGKCLELTARMPYDPAMPLSPAQLDEQQQGDFDAVKLHFGAAGVEVIDRTIP